MIQAHLERGDEGAVRALQPRARGGAHRHARRAARATSTSSTILEQLRSRQIAEEQVETYARQEKAAGKERELREAMARARPPEAAHRERARDHDRGEPGPRRVRAQRPAGRADAHDGGGARPSEMRTLGEARCGARPRAWARREADKVARVGIAEAVAIEEQVRAYGGPQFQVTQHVMKNFTDAIGRRRWTWFRRSSWVAAGRRQRRERLRHGDAARAAPLGQAG